MNRRRGLMVSCVLLVGLGSGSNGWAFFGIGTIINSAKAVIGGVKNNAVNLITTTVPAEAANAVTRFVQFREGYPIAAQAGQVAAISTGMSPYIGATGAGVAAGLLLVAKHGLQFLCPVIPGVDVLFQVDIEEKKERELQKAAQESAKALLASLSLEPRVVLGRNSLRNNTQAVFDVISLALAANTARRVVAFTASTTVSAAKGMGNGLYNYWYERPQKAELLQAMTQLIGKVEENEKKAEKRFGAHEHRLGVFAQKLNEQKKQIAQVEKNALGSTAHQQEGKTAAPAGVGTGDQKRV